MKRFIFSHPRIFSSIIPLVALRFGVSVAYAQTQTSASGAVGQFVALFCRIAGWMFTLLMILSVVMILVAAFHYLTSEGDAEKVRKATHTITYAAVAILVALISFTFPDLMLSIFNGLDIGLPDVAYSTCTGQ